MRLDDRSVRALKPLKTSAGSSPARRCIYDDLVVGLELRVMPSGSKSWSVVYRAGLHARRFTFGSYPTLTVAIAREEARCLLSRIQLGADPAAEKKQARLDAEAAQTFSELATDFIDNYAKRRKRSWKDDQRILFGSPQKKKTKKRPHVSLVKLWGDRKLGEVHRRDVRALLDDIHRRAPIMANRVLACVRKVFNYALEREWVEANPCAGIKAPEQERRRDRVLSVEEIRAVWTALDDEPPLIASIFRLQLLTAQRGGEVLRMQWEELDINAGWWTIPSERSKNKLSHRVPLSSSALDILRELRAHAKTSPHVFQSPKNRKEKKPIAHVQKAIERVRARCGVEFRGHDLRRTAATFMARMGTPRLVIAKVLNHMDSGVTSIYDRASYDAEKRVALDGWARELDRILKDQPASNVVPFAQGGSRG
jgi:integrase